jgi:hypothetical protein
MSENKTKKNTSKRQLTGIDRAIKAGLPLCCPLLDIEKQKCKETNEKLNNTSLCELDTNTNIDYRLCDTFSNWFWATAKKEKKEMQTEETTTENTPT